MPTQDENQPISENTKIRFDDRLPDGVDVVVIGGGVAGVFSALYLNRAGLKVAVLEKGRIAGEQSSRNWGWIRQHGRDPDEIPIMKEASRLWEEADRDAGGKTGFARKGVFYLASTQEALDRKAEWLEIARAYQLDTRILSKREVEKLIRRDNSGKVTWVGATCTPSDARAEPWKAVPAIAELARSEGVILKENCAVRALSTSGGQLTGVVSEAGPVRAEQVVVAGGAWSSLLLRRHGISIPQLSVRSTAVRTAPIADVFSGNAADENLAFRRRVDGGYTLAVKGKHRLYIGPDSFRHFAAYLPALKVYAGDTAFHPWAPRGFPDSWLVSRSWAEDETSPFENMRVLDPPPEMGVVKKVQVQFEERFPELGRPQIMNCWAGMIDAMPDIVPVVDRVPQIEGVIVLTGLSGHGFGIGPGFGKIVAEIATGKSPGHDISRFRFNRFTDGSRLRPGPAI